MSRPVPTALLVLLAAVLAGCSDVFPIGPGTTIAETSDELFALRVQAPAGTHREGRPIEVKSELLYQGPRNRQTIHHAASPVGWRIEQLDGHAVMGGAMADVCASTDLVAGRPKAYPFEKAGVVEDRPPFDQAWFEDPILRLPAGRWRFIATMDVALGDCGGEPHRLETSIDLTVVP